MPFNWPIWFHSKLVCIRAVQRQPCKVFGCLEWWRMVQQATPIASKYKLFPQRPHSGECLPSVYNPFCQQWCQWRALLEGTSLQLKSVLSDSLIVNSHQGRWPPRNEDGQENSLHVILWSLGKCPICYTKSMALESHTPGTDLWLHYSLAGWPWADDLTSLSFRFFICFAGLW